MRTISNSTRNDPEIERLIRESDELIHMSGELTRKRLTKERVRELIRTSDEIARNSERLLSLLNRQHERQE